MFPATRSSGLERASRKVAVSPFQDWAIVVDMANVDVAQLQDLQSQTIAWPVDQLIIRAFISPFKYLCSRD